MSIDEFQEALRLRLWRFREGMRNGRTLSRFPAHKAYDWLMAWTTKRFLVSGAGIDLHAWTFSIESYTRLKKIASWFKWRTWRPMTIGGSSMSDYKAATRRVEVSVGESLRILRELQELSQNQLAELSGIPQSTISAIENDRIQLGVERAKTLARALRCHPAVLVFPGWDVEHESAA
jgi:DNA-binding XRE family transcriptional regulator